jgi:hypothetical protein
MKKSKTRATKPAATANTLPPKKTIQSKGKDARSSTRKSEPGLKTDELISKSNMELDPHLLQMNSARAIARSLKRSADTSERLESPPFHSAMGVLNGLISHVEMLRARLEASKKELRTLYNENDDKSTGEHVPVPPQEYARKRGAPKGQGAPSNDKKPSDNRPRSRPNKVV